jgi:hypothetical protein
MEAQLDKKEQKGLVEKAQKDLVEKDEKGEKGHRFQRLV